MIHDTEHVVIHPLFSDVMGEYFAPECDPEKRIHTVGRLAYAAWSKGEKSPSAMLSQYIPSWARHVEVIVQTIPIQARDIQAVEFQPFYSQLVAVVMRDIRDEQEFSVIDQTAGDGKSIDFTVVDGGKVANYHDLNLGPKLDEAKKHIASAATRFFK